jgi:hypothetical protein
MSDLITRNIIWNYRFVYVKLFAKGLSPDVSNIRATDRLCVWVIFLIVSAVNRLLVHCKAHYHY